MLWRAPLAWGPLAWAALALAASAPSAAAAEHPYHESIAQLERDSTGSALEVALRADAVELETALRRRAEATWRLDEPGVEAGLRRYLTESFLARDATAGWGRLDWVGHELEAEHVWCYFRLRFEAPVTRLQVSHAVLFEQNRYQTNRIEVLGRPGAAPLEFDRSLPWRALDLTPLDLAPGWSLRPRSLPGTDRWWAERGLDWREVLGQASSGLASTPTAERVPVPR